MAFTLTRPEDVLGNPRIARKTSNVEGLTLDEGADLRPGQLSGMIAAADAELRKVTQCTRDDLIAKANLGFPIHQIAPQLMNQQSAGAGFDEARRNFSDAISKMGLAPDIVKEITTGITGGVGGTAIGNWTTDAGPWIYDLETPSKKVFPVLTPIRNKLPRTKGIGTSRRFRRIDGITGSGTGGVANTRISMNESTTENFRGLTLNRPKKISYATSTGNVLYRLQGFSDDLTWAAQYASAGFEDLRGLIAANLLRAHMIGEEGLLVHGRNSAAGGTGAFAAPAAPVLASRAAAAGETGMSGGTTNVYVRITTLGYYGESATSAVSSVAYTGGNVIDVSPTAAGLATGAYGFNVYVGTGAADPGIGGSFKATWGSGAASGQTYSGGNLFTITGALPTTGPTAPAADTGTGSVDDYDGIIPLVAQSGGVSLRVNAALTLDMIEKQLFLPLWNNYKADPDELWCAALESIRITDLVLGASGTPFRVTVQMGEEAGVTGAYRVSRLINKVTGKVVDVTVHPAFLQGTLLAMSYSLPFPYSEIPNVWEVCNVQDYMEVDWPVIQMSYDASTFCYGALVPYATAYNGVLQAIQPS